jgi:hypothetical protein
MWQGLPSGAAKFGIPQSRERRGNGRAKSENTQNGLIRFDSPGFDTTPPARFQIKTTARGGSMWQRRLAEPTGRGAGGGPGKGRAADRFATPWKSAPAPAAQKRLQIGLIGLIHLESPRSATIKESAGPAMCRRLPAHRPAIRWMSPPAPAAQKRLRIGLIGLIHLDSP